MWLKNKILVYFHDLKFFFLKGAAASGPGSAGTFTREVGFISYYEVCDKLSRGWTRQFDYEHLVPYAYG